MSVIPTVWVRPRQGPKLADLIAEPNTTQAHGDSDSVDVLGSAYAATDGDPATAWTAPQRVVQHKTPPTLTLTLPQPTEVTGLRLVPSRSTCPRTRRWWPSTSATAPRSRARPSDIRGCRAANPVAETPGHRHRHGQPAGLARRHRPDALGFDQLKPPGLAEVAVLGTDGSTVARRRRRPQPVARDHRRLRPRSGHRDRRPVRAHLDPDRRSGALLDGEPVRRPALRTRADPAARRPAGAVDQSRRAVRRRRRPAVRSACRQLPTPATARHRRPPAHGVRPAARSASRTSTTARVLVVPESIKPAGWRAPAPGPG